MEFTAETIGAGTGMLVALGGGIAFVWNKIERRFARIEGQLDECHAREEAGHQRRAVQLTVIELLWAEVTRQTPDNAVLRRAKALLDDLKQSNERRDG
jgi:hypothetical protein